MSPKAEFPLWLQRKKPGGIFAQVNTRAGHPDNFGLVVELRRPIPKAKTPSMLVVARYLDSNLLAADWRGEVARTIVNLRRMSRESLGKVP